MATLIPPARWAIRGRSAYRNVASGATLTCTTGLPSATSYTICGWGQRIASNATFEWLASITAGIPTSATDGMLIGWAASGTAIGVSSFTGGDNAFPTNYGTGERIFWCLSNSGTGATSLVGYARRPHDPSLQIKTMTGSTFTVSVISLCNDTTAINEWLNGRVWNVRVFNHQLTAYEVMRESLFPIPIASGLLSWWPLEGNATSMLKDYSGNGNHLTLTGTGRPDVFFLPASVLLPLPYIGDNEDAAAGGTTDAAFSIAVAATSTWTGSSIAGSAFDLHDTQAQMNPTGAAIAAVPFSIAATSVLAAAGTSIAASPFSIAVVCVNTWVGQAVSGTIATGNFSIAASASLNGVGASTAAVPFQITSIALLTAQGVSFAAVQFSINAVAFSQWVGTTTATSDSNFSLTAVGALNGVGAGTAAVPFGIIAAAAGTFFSASTAAAAASIQAASLSTWVGEGNSSAAAARIVCRSSSIWVGRDAHAVVGNDDDESNNDRRRVIWRDAAAMERKGKLPRYDDVEEIELIGKALGQAIAQLNRLH